MFTKHIRALLLAEAQCYITSNSCMMHSKYWGQRSNACKNVLRVKVLVKVWVGDVVIVCAGELGDGVSWWWNEQSDGVKEWLCDVVTHQPASCTCAGVWCPRWWGWCWSSSWLRWSGPSLSGERTPQHTPDPPVSEWVCGGGDKMVKWSVWGEVVMGWSGDGVKWWWGEWCGVNGMGWMVMGEVVMGWRGEEVNW